MMTMNPPSPPSQGGGNSVKRWWQLAKNVYHHVQAEAWRAYYGWPDRKLTLYGVTGTNGKTTTVTVLGRILRAHFGVEKVGLLSTEYFWFGKVEQANDTHMTSTDAKVVFRYLRKMVDAGVTHGVVEMTSHALDQHRLAGLRFAGAIITNISSEHLDYHGTMEEYTKAKMRLARYLVAGASLVVNGDDEWIEKGLIALEGSGLVQPSRGESIAEAKGKPRVKVARFTREQSGRVETSLTGEFNKENVLAASLLAKEIGVDQQLIKEAVLNLPPVPGRVEWVTVSADLLSDDARLPRVVVDFALTPDALERLYIFLRAETKGRLVAVFGAAGERDRGKRPEITRIVARYADEIILTQDEPYGEDEEQIYRELEAGLRDVAIPWKRIGDRREAIETAIAEATSGDVIAITGMGNFSTRKIGEEEVAWSDREVAKDSLRRKV